MCRHYCWYSHCVEIRQTFHRKINPHLERILLCLDYVFRAIPRNFKQILIPPVSLCDHVVQTMVNIATVSNVSVLSGVLSRHRPIGVLVSICESILTTASSAHCPHTKINISFYLWYLNRRVGTQLDFQQVDQAQNISAIGYIVSFGISSNTFAGKIVSFCHYILSTTGNKIPSINSKAVIIIKDCL